MSKIISLFCALTLSMSAVANAGVIFSDDFTSSASVLWGNESGTWYVTASNTYDSTYPSNSPCTYSSLPYLMDDFTFSFTINNIVDGGVWLRSEDNENGILMVAKGTSVYFHEVVAGGFSAHYGEVSEVFTAGATVDFSVVVSGDLYSVYLNGSATPVTTFTSSLYSSGKVALYDYSAQTFDNVTLSGTPIPEPSQSALLGGVALAAFAFLKRRSARANYSSSL